MGRLAIPLVIWAIIFNPVLFADPACETIELEQAVSLAQRDIKNRLAKYPPIIRHVGQMFERRMFDKVMEKCIAGGCKTRGELFEHVHQAVETTMRPIRWTAGAAMVFSVSATAYLMSLKEISGGWGEVAKFGIGFVTLSAAASMAFFHEPLRATVRRMSFALFSQKMSPYSDGFSDVIGSRAYRSEEHNFFRRIAIRWNAAIDSLAVTGWFRWTGFFGSAGNVRGVISDISETFKEPSSGELELLAFRTARWMVDARGLPGAIPFDNPKIMLEIKNILWPNLSKHPELIPPFNHMVKKGLELWDPNYRINEGNSVSSLYYEALMKAWKIDGSPVPKDQINLRPPKGLFLAFDRLVEQEIAREKEAAEDINRRIHEEIEANERATMDAMSANQQSEGRRAPQDEGAEPQRSGAPSANENQVDPTSGAAPLEGPGGE